MKQSVGYIKGIERPIDPAHSAHAKPVVISLSAPERMFLLYRLADRTNTIEAVLHNPPAGKHLCPWNRDLIIVSPLDRALTVQGIEGNPYFAQMRDADPRLTPDALRQANALRERLAALLAVQIARVPLGQGRRRIAG